MTSLPSKLTTILRRYQEVIQNSVQQDIAYDITREAQTPNCPIPFRGQLLWSHLKSQAVSNYYEQLFPRQHLSQDSDKNVTVQLVQGPQIIEQFCPKQLFPILSQRIVRCIFNVMIYPVKVQTNKMHIFVTLSVGYWCWAYDLNDKH